MYLLFKTDLVNKILPGAVNFGITHGFACCILRRTELLILGRIFPLKTLSRDWCCAIIFLNKSSFSCSIFRTSSSVKLINEQEPLFKYCDLVSSDSSQESSEQKDSFFHNYYPHHHLHQLRVCLEHY
ncbi:hypothetical protein V1478_017667 [Vespula squamosa]|uniref:Uncharacterized protein n=1 Tax=Vespula squamosa TaxID=30214 RepID=A0ABD1ZWG8_VESSQ